jgi:hypothetical protein
MKRTLIVFFFFVSLTSLSAQSTFKAGLIAGLNACQFDGDGYSGYHKPGFYGGGFVRHPMSEKWDWSFELCYSQKGAKKIPTDNFPTSYFLALDYVEVPFVFSYHYKKIFLQFGTGLAALVKQYEEVNYLHVTARPFHRLEWSSVIGLGYPITERLMVSCRHVYSILPVRPHASGVTYRLNLGESNNVLNFTFRYEFGSAGGE